MEFKLYVTIFLLFAVACTTKKPSKEYLASFDAYEELLTIEAETRSIIESIEQVLARDTSLSSFSAELLVLSSQLDDWEKRVIAVGSEADHEGHHHSHSHLTSDSLSDTELLKTQISLHLDMEDIASDVSVLVEKMMDR